MDDDTEWYGDMYEVECPFCGTNEVYDLVNEDVHECHHCGSLNSFCIVVKYLTLIPNALAACFLNRYFFNAAFTKMRL